MEVGAKVRVNIGDYEEEYVWVEDGYHIGYIASIDHGEPYPYNIVSDPKYIGLNFIGLLVVVPDGGLIVRDEEDVELYEIDEQLISKMN